MKFLDSVTKTANKAWFGVKAHSPEILLAVGLISGAAAIFMACKETLKLEETIDKSKEELDDIRATKADYDNASDDDKIERFGEDYPTLYKRDLAKAYFKAGGRVVKLYAPAIGLAALSGTSFLASHGVLKKRNVAVTSAYGALDGAFKAYRKRVVDELGEDADKKFKYGITKEKITEEVTGEDGKTKKVKKEIDVVDSDVEMHSDYAKFYDQSCTEWEKDPEYNLMFLKAQQAHANDRLKSRGYLFLNEVYEMLGIEPTRAGQSVGWVYEKDNKFGDNCVDFGIYSYNRASRNFVNGYEPVILLDFNVDGPIIDRVWKPRKKVKKAAVPDIVDDIPFQEDSDNA